MLADVLRSEFSGGVDLAYDGVGGPLLKAVHDHLAPGGAVLLVGSISQYPHNAEVAPHGIAGLADAMEIFRAGETVELEGGRRIVGNVWGDAFSSGVLPTVREELNALHAAGEIVALVDTTASFGAGVDDVPAAVEHMLSGASAGKVTVSFI